MVFFTDTPDGNTLTFEIDATDLNDAFLSPWQGLAFDQNIGFWVHALSGTRVDFGPGGTILSFRYDENSSYDRHDRHTVSHQGEAGSRAVEFSVVPGPHRPEFDTPSLDP